MLTSSRWHLISIGAEKCRIQDLILDFSSPQGAPVPTVALLRNGGGKTTLLALRFAHLLPNARDFLRGRKHNAALIDHIREGDTAHVIEEWVHPSEPGIVRLPSERFVTGMAVERRGTELKRVYYCFRSSPHLNFDSVPWQQNGKRLGLTAFAAALDALGAAHPEISVRVSRDNQTEWREMLESIGIDPEVLRYQKKMNEGEGEASNFMEFKCAFR